MLQMVSWKEYILFILIVLAIYYMYLLIKWYPKELQKLNFFREKAPGDENDNYDWGKVDEYQKGLQNEEGQNHGEENKGSVVTLRKRDGDVVNGLKFILQEQEK